VAGEVDLNTVVSQRGMSVSISTEKSPEELTAEIHEKKEDGALRRHKEKVLFWLSTGAAVVLMAAALVLVFRGDADQSKWAMEVLGAFVGGFVGYLVGRKKE
jgi:hypothetical protein